MTEQTKIPVGILLLTHGRLGEALVECARHVLGGNVPDHVAILSAGQDEPVAAHIRKDPIFHDAFARIRDLILILLPRYRAQGKAYVNIAFGCTGGRHRSVFVAEEMTRVLTTAGYSPSPSEVAGSSGAGTGSGVTQRSTQTS